MAACSSSSNSESTGGSSGSSSSSGGSSASSSSSKSSGGSSGGSSSSSANGGSSSSSSSSKPDSTGGKGGGTGTGTGGKGGGGGSDQGGAGGKGGGTGTGTGTGTGGKGGNGTAGGAVGGSTGGAATGGAGGTGTSTGTGGGTAMTAPAVFISTNGSCVSGTGTTWTPGTLTESTGTAAVTIDGSGEKQTWEGFGGCFNELGWKYLKGISEADQTRVMQLLFGTDGAHFTMGRIPMGASDYAVDRYTCNETSGDTAMDKFSTDRDNQYLIPYITAALKVNPDIKFWASPWTPPTWMKTGPFTALTDDSATTKSNFDSGNMTDSAANLEAYAKYFVKFVDAYKAANINISMVAPQNEPGYALHYPSCLWSAATYSKFVGQYLGPALKDKQVDIMLGTLSNDPNDTTMATSVLADATAKPFFKVAGVQWNVLDKLNSGSASFGGLNVWATEHKCGNYPWQDGYNKTQAPNDQAYGVESWGYIRDAINKGKVTAYNAWNMVLDVGGNGIDSHRQWNQDTLLAIDTGSKAVKVTPAYCVFRHFSQFVDVGAKVLNASGETVAFKNPDGSLVVVMYSAQAKDKFVVSVGGKKYEFNMPAGGWATVKVPKS